MNTPLSAALLATITRACEPQVGDHVFGCGPGCPSCFVTAVKEGWVDYVWRDGEVSASASITLEEYQKLTAAAIRAGHMFTPACPESAKVVNFESNLRKGAACG